MTKQNYIDNNTGLGEGFQLDTGQTLMTGLLSFWKCKEAAGIRYDSADVFNLTAHASVSVNSGGKTGNCAVFEGTDGVSLSHADSTLLPTGNSDFSIGLWCNLDGLGDYDGLFSQWNSDTNNRAWTLVNFTTNVFQFKVSNDGTASTTVSDTNIGAITASTWYHVVAYHDGANDLLGIIVNNGTPDTTAHTTGIFDTAVTLNIGESAANGTTTEGKICDVGIWNKVLSAQEIKDLYNLGNGNTITR